MCVAPSSSEVHHLLLSDALLNLDSSTRPLTQTVSSSYANLTSLRPLPLPPPPPHPPPPPPPLPLHPFGPRGPILAQNCSSPSGRTFFVLPVSMLWMLMQTLSTLCTGDQPADPNRSRQMMPLV
jgi:hypothetical protein